MRDNQEIGIIPGVQSAGYLDIHFTFGTSYERAAPLAEKNSAAGLSDFSVRGAARRHFSLASGAALSQEVTTVK
jgi:hypothetical protein